MKSTQFGGADSSWTHLPLTHNSHFSDHDIFVVRGWSVWQMMLEYLYALKPSEVLEKI